MNKLIACILASGLLVAASASTPAQEAVTVNGVDAMRVVIAPPQSALSRTIKAGLAEAYAETPKGTAAFRKAQKLYFFYGARHFEPLWLEESNGGKAAFSPAAQKIIEVFKAAEAEGFRPTDYLTDAIDLRTAGSDPTKLAALETAFSDTALRYAQDVYGGRIAPSQVSSGLKITPRRINEAEMLMSLASSEAPGEVLLALNPKHQEFVALKAALARLNDGVVEGQIVMPEGPLLKPGKEDERVPLLRTRLNVEAPAEADLVYDEALVEAVKGFQESLGLTTDGVVGPATVAALNGGTSASKEDIIANMERWRWMPEDFGGFHVLVNIPEFRLAVVRGDEVTYTTRVVVGKPNTPTPIFSDMIEHIVVNPYWNVPSSIAQNEIRPHLQANPFYLDSQNMEMLYGGKVVNAAAVDWSVTSVNNFHIRQRPGSGNALGRIKFLFPNSNDVYLHDTPSKSLFSRSFRAYSHGCVRVQNPMEFADALIANEPTLSVAKLESMFGPRESWVNLATQVPVHLAYFTLRVDPDGTIRSYGDVYGYNKKLIELLAE